MYQWSPKPFPHWACNTLLQIFYSDYTTFQLTHVATHDMVLEITAGASMLASAFDFVIISQKILPTDHF